MAPTGDKKRDIFNRIFTQNLTGFLYINSYGRCIIKIYYLTLLRECERPRMGPCHKSMMPDVAGFSSMKRALRRMFTKYLRMSWVCLYLLHCSKYMLIVSKLGWLEVRSAGDERRYLHIPQKMIRIRREPCAA